MSTLAVTLFRDEAFDLQALNAAGEPLSIAGGRLAFAARLSPSAPAVLTAAVGAGIVVTDGALGKFRLTLTSAAKAAAGLSSLTWYYWDVLFVDSGNSWVTPLNLRGELTVTDSITTEPAGDIITGVPSSFSNEFSSEFR